jgi:carboxyl-terminal processing protease
MKFRNLPNLLLALGIALAMSLTPSLGYGLDREGGLAQTEVNPPHTATASDGGNRDIFAIAPKFTTTLVLQPSADDGKIAQAVAQVFETTHYTRHRFDRELGIKMFDRFLDSLDPQRLYFLQSDLDEFKEAREKLDVLTKEKRDVSPAFGLFNRFLLRYDQAYATVIEKLKTGKFSFEDDDKFLVNRKDAVRAANLDEARKLWTDRLRFEYLSEKLDDATTKELITGIRKEVYQWLGTPISEQSAEKLKQSLTNKLSLEKASEITSLVKSEFSRVSALSPRPAQTNEFLETVLVPVRSRLETNRHDEIVKKLVRRYQRTLRNLKQFEPDEVLQLWLDSMGHAFDPHTDYMGKRELDQFAMSMNLRLFGIGATLTSEDGYTVIREIRAGTPAERSKQLKVNDKIVGVAQGKADFEDVMDEKLSKVVDRIRGPKGSEVRLSIIPAGADSSARKVVSLIRDEIKLEDQEAKAKLIELTTDGGKPAKVGVIDLPSFYANFSVGGVRGSGKTTTGDVAKLLKKLTTEGAEGIILDLRRNGGGSLEEAINLTGLFIKSGPVVQVRNPNNSVQIDQDEDESVAYDGPLLVLTSRFSASASEIVAAALQDYGRAVVVGDSTTHGKGTVQTVQELASRMFGVENAGAVKVTIRKFYRANGGSTQLKGVTPDIVLPSVNSYAEVGESSLENALAWDTIPAASYEKLTRYVPLFPELKKRSEERVGKDRDFDFIREDIEKYRKALAEKSITLNESKRRAELEESKAKVEARKKELIARHDNPPTTYEITLKLAAKPGLPPAMTNKVTLTASKEGGTTKPEAGVSSETAATKPNKGDDAEADEVDETPNPVDAHLKEAQRILLDLIHLSAGKAGVAAKIP